MTNARIVGSSLSISLTNAVVGRGGEMYVSRTYQDIPKSATDRKIDFTAVKQALFQSHSVQPQNFVRMTTAPMDYQDLNMTPIGIQDTQVDLHQALPNSGCLTGYVTNFNVAGNFVPSVRFEFNVVMEYCPTADMMSLVQVAVPKNDQEKSQEALNDSNTPSIIKRVAEGIMENAPNVVNSGVQAVDLLSHVAPLAGLLGKATTDHSGNISTNTNKNVTISSNGTLKVIPNTSITIPYHHEHDMSSSYVIDAGGNHGVFPNADVIPLGKDKNEDDEPHLEDSQIVIDDVSESIQIHARQKGNYITINKEAYNRPAAQNDRKK